jgi:hypothetical protein
MLPAIGLLTSNAWHALWYLPLVGLAFLGAAPAEGTLNIVLWLMPLLARLPGGHNYLFWEPWKEAAREAAPTQLAPLYFVSRDDDDVLLSAEVATRR